MKITLFIGGLAGGGAEKVCCNLANFLTFKNHQVTILTMDDGPAQYRLDSKIERHPLITTQERKGKLHDFILRYKRLRMYVKESDTDVFLVMLPVVTILLLSVAHLTKAKIIACERNMASGYSRYKQFFLKHLASHASGWIFQTEDEKDWYKDKLKNIPTTVIPNAINKEFEEISTDREIGDKEIVCVGRLTPQKNHSLLINAFAKIASLYPEYKLIIIGDGPLKQRLQGEIISLGMTDRILLKGYSQNIIDEIKNAEIFVLSSDFEGIPNALMEAMALGLPCISTDCDGGGARMLIQNRQNGILVEKNNVEQLSNEMKYLLDNPSIAERYGKEATSIKKKLSYKRIYQRWLDFIQSIVN